MNLQEGTRRLALLLGAVGAILGGFASYVQLQPVMRQRADHLRFERALNCVVVQQDRNNRIHNSEQLPKPQHDRWEKYAVQIDPKTGERIGTSQPKGSTGDRFDEIAREYSVIHQDGIASIHWTKDLKVESFEMEDGQTLYPTPAPSAGLYLLIAILPVLGFLSPWGAVRAIGWVLAGFVQSSS